MINVLYICHAPDNLGGATYSLFNLIRSVKHHVHCIVVLQREGQVSNFLKENGIEYITAGFPCNIRNNNFFTYIITYPFKRLITNILNVIAIYKIKKALCGRRINIVHSNSSVFIFGDILSKSLHAKHVWHFREFQDIDFDFHPFGGMKDLQKRMYRADALIAITKAVYNHWNFSSYTNSFYIWDAVRDENDRIKLSKKDKYFLFCAAILDKTKGIDTAIRAFGMSGVAKKGYKLIIIGNCHSKDLIKELELITEKYSITDKVEYVGYQKNVKPFMAKATAFIMASHNEGLGRVTIESMFYGCLVIARNSGGTLEFITDGYNGLFFNNDTELSSIIKDVTNEIPYKIIDNAQEFAINNFSEKKYGNKILDIYYQILRNKK